MAASGAARRGAPLRGFGSSSRGSKRRRRELPELGDGGGGGGFFELGNKLVSRARATDFCGETRHRVGAINMRPNLREGHPNRDGFAENLHRPDELVMNWDSTSF